MKMQNDNEFKLIQSKNFKRKEYEYYYTDKDGDLNKIIIIFDNEYKDVALIHDYEDKNYMGGDPVWFNNPVVYLDEKVLKFIEQERKELFS